MAFTIPNKDANSNVPTKNKDKTITPTPPEETITPEETTSKNSTSVASSEILDDDLDKEYREKRNVTIALIHNYSNYRKKNIKTLGQKIEIIGSCIRSCRVLASNQGEVEAYFPAIIGISPNNPNFVTRVKAWLSNISMIVNEKSVVINTSFIYRCKKDYLAIKAKEDEINTRYDSVNRGNISELKKALNEKIEQLNALESTKYQYGRPENIEEYLMYRHCLLYSEVAKDIVLINSNPSIRFYIKDDVKEAEKTKKLIEERKLAMRNFVELDGTEAKFNAVYTAIAVLNGENLIEALLKDRSLKSSIIMDYANQHPNKFNKIYSDKHILTKALVETLISRGELIRSEFNQQISTADGAFVGANLNEAVAYFDNPDNASVRTAYENKLKLF